MGTPNIDTNIQFSFNNVTMEKLKREIKNLDTKKGCLENDIPTKLIKENADIFENLLINDINNSLQLGVFPSILQDVEVIPVFKKGDRTKKENYRPVCILSNISKIYERCIYEQIYSFFDNKLSHLQCGFRSNYGTQHSLLANYDRKMA